MKKIKTLQCINCGKDHKLDEVKYTCLACGGNLQVLYDYNLIKKRLNYEVLKENNDRTIWRYMDLLPLSGFKNIPPVQVGWTPLYKADRLGAEAGVPNLYIKDDGRNPSASFKDRASAVVVAKARELKEKVITTASTGNAASSLACLTGSLDLKTVIFVPETAPAPKVAQLLVFGAVVIMVKGTYDDAFDLCLKASQEYGWYNRSTGVNPFTREGKKTCAFEICEQLKWETPDKVFVPVGDGNIISGMWKGFVEFHRLGIIDKLPQMIAVQAEKSDAIKRAFEAGGEIQAVSGETIADSISVSIPRDGLAAVMAIKDSGGFAVSVTDAEILEAIPQIARGSNVFAEPAAAASYAGLKKAASAGKIKDSESAVVLISGNGLKDVQSAMKSVGRPFVIRPDIGELKKLVVDNKLA
ncbi:MAG: threonine synthase [Elusimicrobia bacterium GWC2_51_8]|nr:MAG: threonine synthase [Elusimicrobia bacterium GWA2_51_34]OGR61790.1 MAG: threonine synthase [Elusimicrobia bacterium GWC2_51_8]OGR86387.1 MAG: threonine synthase [Elusimicrobia bacterium GWF2_52_66]HAF96193.1 threonine synthase [Elusimicrobiota bacterium]HCE97804.1 threonine synthase [Elusimicrobiota bacterium]